MTTSHNQRPIVIKVGGSFFSELASSEASDATQLLKTIATLQENGKAVVLIHGGGAQVLERLTALGMKSEKKDGLRITPNEHMPIVTSVLAGELNKQLVATCRTHNISAVGISLSDGELVECEAVSADLGAVGVPRVNNPHLLTSLLQANIVPVVASIGGDSKGRLYNINADHAAICVAEMLDTQLYFFADVAGVLDAKKQAIHELDAQLCDSLIEQGVITDGMAVKVKAAQDAASAIGHPVTIASWADSHDILIEQQAKGTQILPVQTTNQ